MDTEYIISLIESHSEESLNFEYKSAFKWENRQSAMTWLQGQAIQAILGFTNTAGGGLLLIGVSDDGAGNREFTGLETDMLASYHDLEKIRECIDKFADGSLSYSIKLIDYVSNTVEQTYVAIAVNEFGTLPVLCNRDFAITKPNDDVVWLMRKNDLYARSKTGRFGTIKATRIEMKEVIDLAHTKAEERILQLMSSVSEAVPIAHTQQSPYTEMDQDL